MNELKTRIMVTEKRISELENAIEKFDVADVYSEDMFENNASDDYGTVDVCGYTHDALTLLKKIDEVAFRQEYLNWCDQFDCEDCDEYNNMVDKLEELTDQLDELTDQLDELE